jgi:signal transduction histidine kinase
MSKKQIRFKISLYTRFMIAITFILILLVGSILFVIEKREVRTIFEDARDRGILMARYIANLNLQRLMNWDAEGTRNSIEDQVDGNLLYVVVFERFGTPFVASDLVMNSDDITCCSRLSGNVAESDVAFGMRDFEHSAKRVPVIEIEIPVFAAGSTTKWGSVKVGMSLEEMRQEIRATRWMLILIGCGGFLLGIAGSGLLARRITGPLKKLAEGTLRISRGDFSQQIDIHSQDEIGHLAHSFNEMTSDLLETRQRMEEANRKLVQVEKLASIGRIAATLAHEIRNPLTSVKLNIQKLMQTEGMGEEEKEHLSISQEGIGQMEKFVKEMLNFTRVSELNLERFSMVQIIEEAIKMLKSSMEEKRVVLERTYVENLPMVLVDGDKLKQVFLNVLRNAVEAVGAGGRLGLNLSLAGERGVRQINVRISDSGCGIPEKDWENIFEPFYTTKPSGIGLGLANARKIIEQHRGSIRVVKKRGKGTCFEIQIPCEGDS